MREAHSLYRGQLGKSVSNRLNTLDMASRLGESVPE